MKPIVAAALGLLTNLPAMADTAPAPNIRACVQFIEMPHTAMTELLSGKAQSGEALHDKVMAMTREGKAKLLESAMVVSQSGKKATIGSFGELIYPVESDPPCVPSELRNPKPTVPSVRPSLSTPTAFETRNTGTNLEVESVYRETDGLFDLLIIPDVVIPSRFIMILPYRDRWGDASFRLPVIESWRVNNQLTVPNGRFELAGTITPKPTEPVPATLRKILVFVRCDRVPLGSQR